MQFLLTAQLGVELFIWRFQPESATIAAWFEITSRGGSPAKTFSRAVVEFILNLPDMLVGDFPKVGLLREILIGVEKSG